MRQALMKAAKALFLVSLIHQPNSITLFLFNQAFDFLADITSDARQVSQSYYFTLHRCAANFTDAAVLLHTNTHTHTHHRLRYLVTVHSFYVQHISCAKFNRDSPTLSAIVLCRSGGS
jgi:hypothetical protein